jgi:hypothetical protein
VPSDLSADPPSDAPDALKRVWPLVLRWGVSDDVDRSQLVESAGDDQLRALIDAVAPLYPAINAYLDETGDAEHAVPYGDLAQAALEAEFEIRRRTSRA